MFSGQGARSLKAWLENEAETARSNEDLARRFVEECRRSQVILPGISVIERLCADALVSAERWIESRLAGRIGDETKERLDALLTEIVDGNITRFIWLRRFEAGSNSAGASRLLDRLEFLQGLGLSPDLLSDVPPRRITRLRRQGERYFADGLRDITSDRRLAILAACAAEWKAAIADAVIETHDRAAIVARTDGATMACLARPGGMRRGCPTRVSRMPDPRCVRHCDLSGIWVPPCWKPRRMARPLKRPLNLRVAGLASNVW